MVEREGRRGQVQDGGCSCSSTTEETPKGRRDCQIVLDKGQEKQRAVGFGVFFLKNCTLSET